MSPVFYPPIPSPTLQALYQRHNPAALYPLSIPGLSYPRLVQPLPALLEPGEVPNDKSLPERSLKSVESTRDISDRKRQLADEEKSTSAESKRLRCDSLNYSGKADDKQNGEITKGIVFFQYLLTITVIACKLLMK